MKAFSRELQGKLVTYFIQKLGVVPHRTGWLRQGVCPNCGKVKKLGINLYLNRTNCFSCGYHPVPLLLVLKLENFDTYNEVYRYLEAFESADYLETHLPMLEQKEVILPESFKLLSFGTSALGNMARNYMRKRGYNINALTLRGVGYCTKGDYAYRIIIPFYEKGNLIYFNARQFMEVGSKHKNPPMDEFGIGKSLLLYNGDALHLYKTVYLVESATNALTLGPRAIGTGGKLVSAHQRSKILRSPCKRVVLLWDPDAYWEALHLALDLAKHKEVKVVKMPSKYKGKDNPDVNDLGKKVTMGLIKKESYLTYSQVYKRFIAEPKPVHHLPTA